MAVWQNVKQIPVRIGYFKFLMLIVAILLPVGLRHEKYWMDILIMSFLWAILSLSLNMIMGYLGDLSLAHSAFFGIGGYASGMAAVKLGMPFWFALPFAGIVAALASYLVGYISLKLSGAYFTVATMGLMYIVFLIVNNWVDFTGGPFGLTGIPSPMLDIPLLPKIIFGTEFSYYWLMLIVLLGTLYLSRQMVNCRFGRACVAIRSNEDLAQSVGVNVHYHREITFIVGGTIAGIAGSLYVHYFHMAYPAMCNIGYVVTMQVMVIVGGYSTLGGPIIGAFLFTMIPEFLRLSESLRLLMVGIIFLIFVLLMPRGIWPVLERWYGRIMTKYFPSVFKWRTSATELAMPLVAENEWKELGLERDNPRGGHEKGKSRNGDVLLETQDLTIQFGGLVAVNNLNFQLKTGEILGILGPNGAGKTTCFNMITGFLMPVRGKILYKNEDLVGLRPYQIARRGICRSFQITSLFRNLTVLENVMVGRHYREGSSLLGSVFQTHDYKWIQREMRRDSLKILKLLRMEEYANTRARDLPYGIQRNIEVAVALATEPELLLLDEPAAGMNPAEATQLMGVIKAVQSMGITIMLVEHNMKVAMGTCERIIVLDSGMKIAEGSPREIARNSKVIEVYLGKKRAA